MTLQQLRYVIEVAKTGSMNVAAKQLFVSQPSLSMAIRELENDVHISIFERTTKGVVITAEGEEFLGYARQIINQVELLEDKYIEAGQIKKKFGVSAQHYSFAVKAFVEMVKGFDMDKYEFAIREARTYDVIHDVITGKSEIGILYTNEFNEKVLNKIFKDNQLEFIHLMVGVNAFTLCSGIICEELNGSDYIAVKLAEEVTMDIGYIKRAHMNISEIGELYIEEIKKYVGGEMKS